MTRLNILDDLIAKLIAHGLTDDEILANLTAVDGEAHSALGVQVKPTDLVALLRQRITTPEQHSFAVVLFGNQPHHISVSIDSDGIAFELWRTDPAGRHIGATPTQEHHMGPDDMLEYISIPPRWNEPWVTEQYSPDDQPAAATRIEQARLRLRSVTDGQLAGLESFRDVLDTFQLWDLADASDRRTLYQRWQQARSD